MQPPQHTPALSQDLRLEPIHVQLGSAAQVSFDDWPAPVSQRQRAFFFFPVKVDLLFWLWLKFLIVSLFKYFVILVELVLVSFCDFGGIGACDCCRCVVVEDVAIIVVDVDIVLVFAAFQLQSHRSSNRACLLFRIQDLHWAIYYHILSFLKHYH